MDYSGDTDVAHLVSASELAFLICMLLLTETVACLVPECELA